MVLAFVGVANIQLTKSRNQDAQLGQTVSMLTSKLSSISPLSSSCLETNVTDDVGPECANDPKAQALINANTTVKQISNNINKNESYLSNLRSNFDIQKVEEKLESQNEDFFKKHHSNDIEQNAIDSTKNVEKQYETQKEGFLSKYHSNENKTFILSENSTGTISNDAHNDTSNEAQKIDSYSFNENDDDNSYTNDTLLNEQKERTIDLDDRTQTQTYQTQSNVLSSANDTQYENRSDVNNVTDQKERNETEMNTTGVKGIKATQRSTEQQSNKEQLLNSDQQTVSGKADQTQCAENIEELLFGAPAIHGRVDKKGVLPMEKWFNASEQVMLNTLYTKLDTNNIKYQDGDITVNGSVVETPPPIPVSGRCGVYINHEHKFIFVKSTKVAGTSFLTQFGWFCDKGGVTKDCFRMPDVDRVPNAEVAQQMWRDYFVFAVSRGAVNCLC